MPSKGIDQVLYPDIEPPERFESFSARVDFLARLWAAWDVAETVTRLEE